MMRLLNMTREEREKEILQLSRSDNGLNPQERRYLYDAREGLKYLPRFGPYGGIMSKIARKLSCSRAYVQSTLFPNNPENLFGNSPMQRQIWGELAREVYDHPLYESLREAFERLRRDREVRIKMPSNIYNFFINRCPDLGLRIHSTEKLGGAPITYLITLESDEPT